MNETAAGPRSAARTSSAAAPTSHAEPRAAANARIASIRFRVRYAETDQMGVVYHANYLVWCDMGRTELMRRLGVVYADVERAGTKLAVAEAALRYARAARFDDPIRVDTELESAQSRGVSFRYRIYREADGAGAEQLLATASTRLIAIDDGGAPRRLPPEVQQKFREIVSVPA